MMDMLQTIFAGVLGGGATGLLGVLLQRWFDLKRQQADAALVKLQLDAARETRMMEIEAQAKLADRAASVAELQSQLDAHAREVEADTAAYTASLASDRATYLDASSQGRSRLARWTMALVDAVRGLVRPGVTAYTLWLLTAVFWWVRDMYKSLGLQMSPNQVHDLAVQCVGTVFYLSTTTVIWWFGVRPGQPPKARVG